MLNCHLLLAAASVSLERLDLRRPGELVEGGLGTSFRPKFDLAQNLSLVMD